MREGREEGTERRKRELNKRKMEKREEGITAERKERTKKKGLKGHDVRKTDREKDER